MGSLFKLRDHWNFTTNEEFGQGSLALGNVDNDPSGAIKIVIGSYQGILRILCPAQKGFRPEDVLFEKPFGAPILQVSIGNYLPNNANRNALAILLPRKLIIASVSRVQGGGKQAKTPTEVEQPTNFFFNIVTHVEHLFDHTSCNFTQGAFGSQGGEQEFICVQSMDGQVSFLDHNKLMFQRFLPSLHFLVPGIITYCPKMDAFLTNSSSFELQAYKYQSFTQSTGSAVKDSQAQEGRKIVPDWSFNLGEDAVCIRWCRLTRGLPNHEVDIVCLCERTLFVIKENGELRFNRRLDMAAMCGATYLLPDGKNHNFMLFTHTNQCMVYTDTKLVWSAKVPSSSLCVACDVGVLCGVQGMIALVGDEGSLSLNYLGTDPANNPIQVLESKELDYDAMDEEHRRLQQVIRQATNGVIRAESKDIVKLRVDPPTPSYTAQGRMCRVVVHVSHAGTEATQKATLVANVAEPLLIDQPSVVLPSIYPGDDSRNPPVVLTVYTAMDNDCLIPTSLGLEFVLTYTTQSGENLTSRASVQLPFGLVATPVPPLKNIQFKVQVDTNKAPPPNLQDLFSDLTLLGEVSPNVLSVQYCNGSDATVLVSKNAGRYRVQSTTFDGLWLMTSELVQRLRAYYQNDRTDPLRIEMPEGLPLEEYGGMIDMHCQMRAELQGAQQRLAEVAHQFRAIQKRLLVRFRDRNPAPLSSLEQLFEETYRRMHVSSDEVDVALSRLRQAGVMLSASTHLLLLIIRHRCQDTLSKDDWDVLRYYLSPVVQFSPSGIGWEEMTDASMTHLLRTSLSRNAKEASVVPQPLAPSTDSVKLKKHLTIVLDRISRGASLSGAPNVEVADGTKRTAETLE